jgi:endonuclease/exonuclease/phosphatase family metal-dependent hydrolase
VWLESGQFWLSENPDEKFSKSWDSSLPRVATWVRLKDKKSDGREVLFANTHFDHRGVEARIDRPNDNARFPSDHFPVTAVLQWSK